jgi:hypothetical protein
MHMTEDRGLSADNAQRLEELLAAEIPRWREATRLGYGLTAVQLV